MAHVLKDFFTGSLILVALTLSALVGFVLFLILNIFFHIFGALVVVFFLFFLSSLPSGSLVLSTEGQEKITERRNDRYCWCRSLEYRFHL